MTFSSIYDLLRWYVRRQWIHLPRETGNHDPWRIGGSYRTEDIEDTWTTAFKIRAVFDQLPPRDVAVMVNLFEESRPVYKEIGRRFQISARTVARIRHCALPELEEKCKQAGLVWNKYEPLTYAKE